MAEGMMNNPNAMGGQPPMSEPPMGNPMGGTDDAVLDMHLTEDVKKALSAKGIDIGPMKQFVQDMTANAAAPATEPAPEMAMAEATTPSPEGLGAPTQMDRPPMTA
jgi:hypothetical protein